MPKPRVGVVGTDMEWGPMGELMTEKGGPMPLTGELSVLMGECSCPGEPSEAPRPGPSEGCSEGAAMELRPVGEPRDEELTWVEKSAREAPRGQSGTRAGSPPPLVRGGPRGGGMGSTGPGQGRGHPHPRGPRTRSHEDTRQARPGQARVPAASIRGANPTRPRFGGSDCRGRKSR